MCCITDDLGLTGKQKYDIGILIHVLYNNPKVLYAPNNTEADTIIRKVSVALDHICRKWMIVSYHL